MRVAIVIACFLYLSQAGPSYGAEVEERDLLQRDLKESERLILDYLKLEKPPFGSFSLDYRDDIDERAGFRYGTILFSRIQYEYGYLQKYYTTGVAQHLFPAEAFSGYVRYAHQRFHDVAHNFFNRHAFCGLSLDSQEGFPEFIVHELLIAQGKKLNDPEYERYVVRYIAVYIAAYNYLNKSAYLLSDLPISLDLSEKAKKYLDDQTKWFLERIDQLTSEEKNWIEATISQYALGWTEIYLWRAKSPRNTFEGIDMSAYKECGEGLKID